eukprot:CAMPEP_0182442924 /NCGR_PEP_ID=MMETSP1172-20130603/1781_1 /TAXON_ID=708627 /ORGANISM="Timspurckia oligopyrenoides, Strain CCMP3278" /LENGTH=631 /DNA_ID=CAMNT_0024638013 /DNA_START=9 /DNA_END=1904 /DNA_ORIENTATION=-
MSFDFSSLMFGKDGGASGGGIGTGKSANTNSFSSMVMPSKASRKKDSEAPTDLDNAAEAGRQAFLARSGSTSGSFASPAPGAEFDLSTLRKRVSRTASREDPYENTGFETGNNLPALQQPPRTSDGRQKDSYPFHQSDFVRSPEQQIMKPDFMHLMANSLPPDSPMVNGSVMENAKKKSSPYGAAPSPAEQLPNGMYDPPYGANSQGYASPNDFEYGSRSGIAPPPSVLQNGMMENELAALEADLNEALHQKAMAEDGFARAMNELEMCKRNLKDLEDELSESERRAAQGKKTVWELKRRVDEMEESQKSGEAGRNQRLDAELAAARSRVTELEGTMSGLQRQIGAMEAVALEAKKSQGNDSAADKLRADAEQRALERVQALEKQLAQATSDLDVSKKLAESNSKKLKAAEAELKEKTKALEEALIEDKRLRDNSAALLYELEMRNEALSNELEQVKREADATVREFVEVEGLQQRIASVTAERDALLEEQKTNETMIADIETREHALKQLVQDLEAQLLEFGVGSNNPALDSAEGVREASVEQRELDLSQDGTETGELELDSSTQVPKKRKRGILGRIFWSLTPLAVIGATAYAVVECNLVDEIVDKYESFKTHLSRATVIAKATGRILN